MKKTIIYCFIILISGFAGCKKDDEEEDLTGDWVRASDFEGVPRNGAFAFTINDKAYVGTGYDGNIRLADTWMFEADKNTWFSVATFPGKARSHSVTFVANGKGYVGTGFDGDQALKDFWEYDPQTNKWKEIAPLPTTQGRYEAVGFAIANMGYVGAGKDNDRKDQQDFYCYNPIDNSWRKVASLGIKRSGAFSFVLGTMAYVGGGTNNGSYSEDFYQYNPSTDRWSERKDLDQSDNEDNDDDYVITRANAATFVIDGTAYVISGNLNYALASTWKYDETGDRWIQVDNLEGSPRAHSVAFSIGNKGYITTGNSGSLRYDDNWRFDPQAPSDN